MSKLPQEKAPPVVTTNIDCAAYLLCKGISPLRVKRLAHKYAQFFFPNTKSVLEIMDKFLRGRGEVNIGHYLYNRGTLKIMVDQHPLRFKSEKQENGKVLINGMPYFYIFDGKVATNIYGLGSPIHKERAETGNLFYSRQEAEAALRQGKRF